ncbi:MAG: hypothetical protein M1285_02895 [Candidatus Thermoplasmatota archaeon]|nr:hypothetical protein [Candidatus Thermoplasmatota archaeon]
MVALIPSKKDKKGNWLCPGCGSSDLIEDEMDDGTDRSIVMCKDCGWNVYGPSPQMSSWDEDDEEEI